MGVDKVINACRQTVQLRGTPRAAAATEVDLNRKPVPTRKILICKDRICSGFINEYSSPCDGTQLQQLITNRDRLGDPGSERDGSNASISSTASAEASFGSIYPMLIRNSTMGRQVRASDEFILIHL